ncbi:hypothetical protein CORC01_11780 [Colletotrichum orchidophilum]|uniref:Uncharacterized protein n=1 Tax=Colletotrichum orchidophilum TaxID=1209926 RepID=A0A1G4AV06_9PEZI|nr:uncharacterized protein CORC01_11780 [Colletotrichum orchidophilum]OHE92913.1 hypothetical protein CORC01_11780 [Colletotrichum orchidophilum]
MQSPKLSRGICALFVVLMAATFTTASPVAVNSQPGPAVDDTSIAPRASGGGWCWPFCNPFLRGVNTPSTYNFRTPPSTAVRPQYFDVPGNQLTIAVQTMTTGAVQVTVSLARGYTPPSHAQINVRLRVGTVNIDFNHANLQFGSETAGVEIPAEQAAEFRTAQRPTDGSFTIKLLYELDQDL